MYEFGREILDTNDLDPVYVILHQANLPKPTLEKWLLAYWCFYHVGTASWIADNPQQYWTRMETAAGSKEYPRSSERRHFRGENARKSVAWLRSQKDNLFPSLAECTTAAEVVDFVQGWYGFGPWISFKVADMLERLGLIPDLRFDTADLSFYDSPAKGAVEHASRELPSQLGSVQETVDWSVNRILNELGYYAAPPAGDRFINVQEAETILCKWKSYLGDHYEVGEDIEACRLGLLRFPECRTTQRLLRAMRDAQLDGSKRA